MNVFIFPTDDPTGFVALIKHHCMAGNVVFVPKHSSIGINHSRTAMWPAYLSRSMSKPDKRNIEIHGFNFPASYYYGEDHFLKEEDHGFMYDDNVSCEMIDLAVSRVKMDAYHTTRGEEAYLRSVRRIVQTYMPQAKWISSTLTMLDHNVGGHNPRNIAKFVPGDYDDMFYDRNQVNIQADDFERKLLGVSDVMLPRQGFASFYDGRGIKEKLDSINEGLPNDLKITNYGGNWRLGGADTKSPRLDGKGWTTLSPRKRMEKMRMVKAIVILKRPINAGEMFYHATMTATPMIVSESYIRRCHGDFYLRPGLNCLIYRDERELVSSIKRLNDDEELQARLTLGMMTVPNAIFDDSYWTRWRVFLERLV